MGEEKGEKVAGTWCSQGLCMLAASREEWGPWRYVAKWRDAERSTGELQGPLWPPGSIAQSKMRASSEQ